jgi:glycosidase
MASTMPISSSTHNPHKRFLLCALLFIAAACATAAPAQTLARPGWVGSGLTPTSWWRHAVLYQVDPHNFQDSNADGTGDLRGLTQRLDYLQSLGVDALLLNHLQPAEPAPNSQPIDPALGTLDDFDDLIIQASRHSIRVLIELQPPSPTADLSGVARFWLSRGIAGFHLASTSADNSAQLHTLRTLAKSYVGERVLIGDLTASDLAQKHSSPAPRNADAPQLLLNPYLAPLTQLDPTAIRAATESNDAIIHAEGSVPLALTDASAQPRSIARFADGKHDTDIAKVVATLLLTTRASAMLTFGQEIGFATPTAGQPTLIPWGQPPTPTAKAKSAPAPDPATVAAQDADPHSLLNWYRQLSVLQHSSLTLHSGANLSLNHDDQHVLAWVRKPQSVTANTPPIVFICNLSAQPVQLSLKEDMQHLHLRGSFLRTILRSDSGMGALHLDSMTLPPFAIYVGELRY